MHRYQLPAEVTVPWLDGPWSQAKDLPLKRNTIKLSGEEYAVFAFRASAGARKAAASLKGNAYQSR